MNDRSRALILNIDDTDASRYLISRILNSHGYAVIEALNGLDGISLAEERQPDLIITDVKLPDLDGFEVCRALRSNPETKGIPIVMTSAMFTTSGKKGLGIESGANAYVTQPFEPLEMLALIQSLLRIRLHEREAQERAEQLLAADRRKDEFLAMLGHELRNPLSAVLTGAQLLSLCVPPGERASKIAGTIERQARHLTRLVDDLLDVSRITQGKIELLKERIDLAKSIDQAAQTMRPMILKNRQELTVMVSGRPLWMHGDATRIEQVLCNLITNASKYTPAGGKIVVTARLDEGQGKPRAVVSVRDTGIGIAPEHLASIFDLFFQVDGENLARSAGGLGIGLTMVSRLVALHQGSVRALSDGPGTGSELVVELPLLSADNLHAGPVDGAAAPTNGHHVRRRRVMLVDDNVDACTLMQAALQIAGHQVDMAHDGESGLRAIHAGSYDAAVIDIGLPLLDGFALARAVRSTPLRTRPYLIALTGYGRPEDRERALCAGFDEHLSKPADIDRLQSMLRAVPLQEHHPHPPAHTDGAADRPSSCP
ncbi:response regulator [Chondromyces apiculatus]|uniref:histidine kinase n=1 Tax=Chondromyces apiculatus DSM 436 TaxID=1192034 RepID=A0A017TC16_9BACT|nr:response regulator [Chondromyces apiculatus]EYF06452.1 Chemotaxis protein methyltransferase CheR [Chondromyces apiculatus DSM 436]